MDAVGRLAGEYMWSLAIVGGSAWKMEGCLASFLRREMPRELEGGVQVLLRGLPGAKLTVAAHAVQSVDWYWPTAGEQRTGHDGTQVAMAERRGQLQAERERAEAVCREALAESPAVRDAAVAHWPTRHGRWQCRIRCYRGAGTLRNGRLTGAATRAKPAVRACHVALSRSTNPATAALVSGSIAAAGVQALARARPSMRSPR